MSIHPSLGKKLLFTWEKYSSLVVLLHLKEKEKHYKKSFTEASLQNEATSPLCSTGSTLTTCCKLSLSRSDRCLWRAHSQAWTVYKMCYSIAPGLLQGTFSTFKIQAISHDESGLQ